MELKPLIPVAQYVRMSTEEQQYSIANQKVAIQMYAESHGFIVVSTYADAGKSGVAIKHRKELRRLLHDVTSGQAQYQTILVYDVSRWGRFQDVDEAAHYEFLCKSAGIPVRYCAEQFDNDGSLPSSMMKALKRTMAAEYSRELGIKVSAGQRRLSLLGFRVVGRPGYGLRRMMVSPDGRRRLILNDGERKGIQTDRTILVPGPRREVECIRRIFEMAARRKSPKQIARELNAHQVPYSHGRLWDYRFIYHILKNEKYTGCNTYGMTTRKLCSPSQRVEKNLWIRNPEAFDSIVSRSVFDRVQKLIQKRATRPKRSDACLIQAMRRVLAREGKITQTLLKKGRGKFDHRTYYKRFGSVMRAYELAGYRPPSLTLKINNSQKQVRLLRNELYLRLRQLFPDHVRFISLAGQTLRKIVEIDGCVRVAIYLCRAVDSTDAGESGWCLRVRPLERDLPVLICTMDQSFSKLLNFYVLAPIVGFERSKVFRENQIWLSAGRKLGKLEDFCDVAKEITSQPTNIDRYTSVDDIRIAADSWTITIGTKEITLGFSLRTILNMLVLNPGVAVSQDRLSEHLRDPMSLGVYMHNLRLKMGEARRRIRSVPGMGYMYVSPSQGSDLEPPR
jgi:DNA invertase Pin-like site-specific DNA recombinase